MPRKQSLVAWTLSTFSHTEKRRKKHRRRATRRLRSEALEARQLLAGDLWINEIMADNDATIEDPDEAGAFEDWVEIYNSGTSAIDLGGMYLTDDLDAPDQWQFPAGSTIAAGGYLLIWADGEPEQGGNHASFKLSSGGEAAALFDVDGKTLVDSIEFGEQLTDVAFGRSPDGGETLSVLSAPTPNAANSLVGEANFAPVANAGGPYFATTADLISLNASSSSDIDGNIADYAWDFDQDGDYDDATGETVNFASATAGTFVVGLQVTDDDGATSWDTGTIKVSTVGDTASPWDPVTIDDEAAAFFDDTYVHELHINFEDDDWYNTLFASHDTDPNDPYFIADFVADGIAVNGVGVRFKGNSSFSGPGVKKSIKIDFNEFEDLTFLGLKKLNLNNNTNDPTMLREKLFYDYASNFVEGVGRAVHTNVYINGELYGLYTAVEQVDSTFTQSRFGDDEDGNLYKGTASDDAVLSDPQADFGSDLTYLGTDQADYEAFYDLKTNEAANDYSQLIEFIDVLNNTPVDELPDAIEPILDVQDTLASLALNNLFVNLDSYIGAAHNYYVYDRDDTGQFTHLFWDVNESFGTFTQFVERGTDVVQLDPFFLPVGTSSGRPGAPVEDESRPLAESLFAVDDYSIDYLRDLAQMLEEGFDVTSATARINELANLIRTDVIADPNKPFTTDQFEQNLTTNVTEGRRTIYGLTSFIDNRSTYLASALAQYDLEPESVEVYINEIMADNDATIEDPDEAGAFEDWIELYNPGAASIDLSGFYLTDDAEDPTQWEFPRGSTIDANGYLIIWADDDSDQGDDHAAFKLSAGGESVLLYHNDGETLVDSVEFGEQATDVSYGRFPDGSSTFAVLSAATPGASNTNDATPDNVAPTAEAGGPYAATVGDTITLSAATSTDTDGTISTYAWDLDHDGQYDDATGESATFNASGDGTFTVGLQVTDDDGATGFDTATVTVSEVPVSAGLIVVESGGSTLVNENGGSDAVSISLSRRPTADVTVMIVGGDAGEVSIDTGSLNFTPENWDVTQTFAVTGLDDGFVDDDQVVSVTLEVASLDASYDTLPSTDIVVTNEDTDSTTDVQARIIRPDFVVRPHSIAGDSVPTAILFVAHATGTISVTPVGSASVGETVRLIDDAMEKVSAFDNGITQATVVAGETYAILFGATSDVQVYSVTSTAGTDAFTQTAATNFLQPTDTNGDSQTSPSDALIIINHLRKVARAEGESISDAMLDVNQSGSVSPVDALNVINHLRRQRLVTASQSSSEGEANSISQLDSGMISLFREIQEDVLEIEALSPDSVVSVLRADPLALRADHVILESFGDQPSAWASEGSDHLRLLADDGLELDWV